jgi:lipoyl(octanoyl) transferase
MHFMRSLSVQRLGVVSYADGLELQRRLVDERKADRIPDTLLLLQHPHVLTIGVKKDGRSHILAPADRLASLGVEVFETGRGGDVTYHGPGQLVAYPIVLLEKDAGEQDLHKFLRNLEEAVIQTCLRAGLTNADREPGKTGVWTTDPELGSRKKLCSMGIACRKWVTFHGLALNVTTDLSYFARINPCGFEASVMSSLDKQLAHQARTVDMAQVKALLVEELGRMRARQTV